MNGCLGFSLVEIHTAATEGSDQCSKEGEEVPAEVSNSISNQRKQPGSCLKDAELPPEPGQETRSVGQTITPTNSIKVSEAVWDVWASVRSM